MAFSNITNLQLGSLLQIVFTNGVRNQISLDHRDFEMIKRARQGSSVARQLNFEFQKGFGPSAISWRNPGTSNRAFPTAQQSSLQENIAMFKEIQATIEVEYNIYDRARKSPETYGKPLAIEIASKSTASKRRMAADLYGDGTGVIGQLPASGASVTSPASNVLNFQLSLLDTARGHSGFFEPDDILILRTQAGVATALDTNLATEPAYWKVVSRDYETQLVQLQGLDSSFAAVATITAVTVQPEDTSVFYRYQQPTIPNLSTIGSSDYGTLTEVMAGLESLVAADGRVIHGITMSGSTAGTQLNAGGNPIDVSHIQKVMSKTKNNVGQDRYKWKMMIQAPATYDAFVESRETDRRFITIDDVTRGAKKIMYQHQNDSLECYTSEFCPPKRMYILPESKAGEKVLEFHGSDFESVKGEDMSSFHLKPGSGGGHVNTMVSYLNAIGVMICNHPAAVAVVRNFTNS